MDFLHSAEVSCSCNERVERAQTVYGVLTYTAETKGSLLPLKPLGRGERKKRVQISHRLPIISAVRAFLTASTYPALLKGIIPELSFSVWLRVTPAATITRSERERERIHSSTAPSLPRDK